MTVEAAPVARVEVARRRRSVWRALPNYLFILPYLAAFVGLSIGPLLYTIYMSFYNRRLFDTNSPFVGFGNYTALWSDQLWLTVLWNTVEFVIVTVTLIILSALGAALLLRAVKHGQAVLRVIFFAPTVFSVAIVAIIWGWLLSTDLGAINYLLSLVGIGKVGWTSDPHLVIPMLGVATTWWGFGFPMVVFLAGLLNIPGALYEAAAIDGANAWQRFTTITLPLLRPTILFVLVTQVIAHFQVFGQPFFITAGGPGDSSRTILMFLYDTVWRHFQYGYGASIAITLALIMALITAIQFGVLGSNTVET
jgi:multiple sugar transport system permease protein